LAFKAEKNPMQIPLQITFHGMEPSPAVEARIREKVAKLELFHDRIVGCKVVVEAPHRHHKGKLYNVCIDISVPGKDIFVGHTGPQNHAHEDIHVAIRDAFNAAGRLLEDHVRRMRGDVKTHRAPLHGKVVRLFEDYGFAEQDGQEVYFHKNSVVDDAFDKLEVGSEVRLVIAESEGVEGAQASTVTPIGKHHIVE
jgi:ribosome-associated translation inhibitor RaiA/cold shock CspA family protein